MNELEPIDFRGLRALRLQAGDDCAIVARFGAQVLSWSVSGEERLFLSERAVLDGRAPIRGGVPVVFPQFATYGSLPQHGFARTRTWRIERTGSDAQGAFATLTCTDDADTSALWPHAFAAALTLRIAPARLALQLHVENTGEFAFDFSAALHAYLCVDDIATVQLTGLEACRYRDRAAADREDADRAPALQIASEVDRLYLNPPRRLTLNEPRRALAIETDGFPETVVWNPWRQRCAQIPDMAPDGYRRMLCVEAAAVAQRPRLEPGAAWNGEQRLLVLSRR